MSFKATKVSEGALLDYTPGSAVSAGDVIELGNRIAVANADIAASRLGALSAGGVFKIQKAQEAVVAYAPVFWDNDGNPYNRTAGTGAITCTGTGNVFAGIALAAAAATDETVTVLVPSAPTPPTRRKYTNVAASAAHTNTTDEALFDKSYSIAANTIQDGDIIHVVAQVIATATNSTDTLTVKLYIGGLTGTAVCSTGAVDVANNDIAYIDAWIVCRTDGATGTIVATGTVALGVEGTVTAKPFKLASTAIDTTAAQVIGVGADWSVANAGNSCRLDVLIVEHIKA